MTELFSIVIVKIKTQNYLDYNGLNIFEPSNWHPVINLVREILLYRIYLSIYFQNLEILDLH